MQMFSGLLKQTTNKAARECIKFGNLSGRGLSGLLEILRRVLLTFEYPYNYACCIDSLYKMCLTLTKSIWKLNTISLVKDVMRLYD